MQENTKRNKGKETNETNRKQIARYLNPNTAIITLNINGKKLQNVRLH